MTQKTYRKRVERKKRERTLQIIRRVAAVLLFAGMATTILIQNTMFSDAATIDDTSISNNEVKEKIYHLHEVKDGDTLYGIASTYMDLDVYEDKDAYLQEVMYINGIYNPDKIKSGTNIIVPVYVSTTE